MVAPPAVKRRQHAVVNRQQRPPLHRSRPSPPRSLQATRAAAGGAAPPTRPRRARGARGRDAGTCSPLPPRKRRASRPPRWRRPQETAFLTRPTRRPSRSDTCRQDSPRAVGPGRDSPTPDAAHKKCAEPALPGLTKRPNRPSPTSEKRHVSPPRRRRPQEILPPDKTCRPPLPEATRVVAATATKRPARALRPQRPPPTRARRRGAERRGRGRHERRAVRELERGLAPARGRTRTPRKRACGGTSSRPESARRRRRGPGRDGEFSFHVVEPQSRQRFPRLAFRGGRLRSVDPLEITV